VKFWGAKSSRSWELDQVTLSPNECDALAAAWLRAGPAMRAHEYSKITVIDDEGDEILEVGIDYKNTSFDMEDRLPLLQQFNSKPR
jgi:hypothetical protein